jgi:hypothetical protein
MTQVIRGSRRVVVIAALAAALLGGAALLAISPAPASAAFHPCGEGEFCLYFNEDANGGFYHFTGSDWNLNNDHYEGGDTGGIVGDTARYVYNAGIPGPKDDVVIYGLPGYKGANDCVRLNTGGRLPRNWWNNIESYRWVTNSECEAAGVLSLPAR